MVLTKMFHKSFFLIIKLRKLGRKCFCLLFDQITVFYGILENPETHIFHRMNINEKMVSNKNTLWLGQKVDTSFFLLIFVVFIIKKVLLGNIFVNDVIGAYLVTLSYLSYLDFLWFT